MSEIQDELRRWVAAGGGDLEGPRRGILTLATLPERLERLLRRAVYLAITSIPKADELYSPESAFVTGTLRRALRDERSENDGD